LYLLKLADLGRVVEVECGVEAIVDEGQHGGVELNER
jgi:hypothetical protein